MRKLAVEATREPTQQIRERVICILRDYGVPVQCGSRPWFKEIRACQLWVQNSIRYLRDPPDAELVQTPFKTLEYSAGDCDDQATLLASFLHSIGHPTRFIAVAFRGGPFSHVLCQTRVGRSGNDRDDWISCETIVPRPLGWHPPGVTATMPWPPRGQDD